MYCWILVAFRDKLSHFLLGYLKERGSYLISFVLIGLIDLVHQVIQHRGDYGEPRVNFTADWETYKHGFGNLQV